MAPERRTRAAASTPSASQRKRFETFRALRNVDYRHLWIGQVAHAASLWMEQVVRPLLMLDLTGSALQVGNIIVARMVPQLVSGLITGAVVDRYDKRRVLLLSQSITMSSQLILGILVVSSNLEIWHIYVTAVASGSANAFTQPARSSIIPRLVRREDLLNAVALNTAAMNTMRIVGAGLGGLLLIPFDFGEVYILNAVVYLGVIYTTVRIHVPATVSGAPPAEDLAPQDRCSAISWTGSVTCGPTARYSYWSGWR